MRRALLLASLLSAGAAARADEPPVVVLWPDGAPALHVYSGVGHGFGVRDRNTGPVAHWLDRVHDWLDGGGLLKK